MNFIDLTQLFAILGLLTNVVLMTGSNFVSQNNLDLFDIGLTVKKRSRHKSTSYSDVTWENTMTIMAVLEFAY